MSAYGVDQPGWVALPWSWAAERLVPNRSYWLVTVSGTGRPHALPVWGVWDEAEHRFAFSCPPGSRKARNLAADPRVVVTADDTVECVSVEGRAVEVSDEERLATWIERYLAKYQPLAPELDERFLRENRFLELEPERAFGVIERNEEFSARATRWVFDER